MAGVKAHAQLFVISDSVINACQLFKRASGFRTFSCHRLKSDTEVYVLCKHLVQTFDDLADSGISPFAYMGTRVEDQDFAFTSLGAFNLGAQEINRELISFWLYSISEVDDVGGMHDDFVYIMFFHITPRSIDI